MPIHTHFAQLLPLFAREHQAGRSIVLATIVHTAGSTYRKAGAQMLITQDGEYAGLLSGGCLEGDLREHAKAVLSSEQARVIEYDMRSADDQLFGLGAGCEGAMKILLQYVGPATQWQPMIELQQHWQHNRVGRLALVVNSTQSEWPVGGVLLGNGEFVIADHSSTPTHEDEDQHQQVLKVLLSETSGNSLHTLESGTQLFLLSSPPAPRVLILGAGPDAQPLAQLIHFLGWKASIYDHRSAYTTSSRFPHAEQIVTARPAQLHEHLQLDRYDAIVVMSHHLDSDLQYLRAVARCQVSYIGLLGPAARRERLFADLGADYNKLRERLHAPVGLQIGAATPESIALAIIGEVHAVLAQ